MSDGCEWQNVGDVDLIGVVHWPFQNACRSSDPPVTLTPIVHRGGSS